MSPQAEAELRQAVCASPEADEPRLVFADALTQRGEPQGELIVAACMLARPDLPVGTRRALQSRHDALMREHQARWLGELGLRVGQAQFVRGLVEVAWVPWRQVAKSLDALLTRTPLRSLMLSDVDSDGLRALRFCPHVSRLEQLGFERLARGAVEQVGELENTQRLRGLRVCSTELRDRDLSTLAQASVFAQVTELRLDRNGLGPGGAQAIAESPVFTQLTALELASNQVTTAGARALAESSNLRGLTSLGLSQNGLDAEGVRAVVGSAHVTKLTSLDVGFNPVADAGALEVAQSMWLGELESLTLEQAGVGTAGARALAGSVTLRKLKVLELGYNRFTEADEAALRERFGFGVRLR